MKIEELENYFATVELPKSIKLNRWTFISDARLCVESLLRFLNNHPKNKGYMPYYRHLLQIYNFLNNGKV